MGTKPCRIKETPVEADEDIISSLQDDLLCRILSLLPTKDTVVTSALSTRWKNLYASVTDLTFSDCEPGTTIPANNVNFIAFVTNVISAVLSKSKYIRKLDLSCSHGSYPGSLVSSWVAEVLGPNLQDLYICAQTTLIGSVPLPPQLFHSKALTSMEIRGPFSLCVPEHVVFPSLKSLTLCLLILPDEVSLKRLFSGCVVLEKLGMWRCAIDSIGVFEVSIASLKHLSLDDISGNYELFLNTPNLESFDFDGYASRGYSGDTLKSLSEAKVEIDDIDYEIFAYEQVSLLINMVSNARSLWLGKDSMESSYYHTTIFHKLTKLSLHPARADGWFSLPKLLANAPCLKILDFIHGLRGDLDEDLADVEFYLPEQVPVCVSAHLKEVIFGKFSGEEGEFKVVEYFLQNAEVLERMSISPNPSWDSESEDWACPSSEDQFPMAKRLLGLPRWSRACQIDFAYTYW